MVLHVNMFMEDGKLKWLGYYVLKPVEKCAAFLLFDVEIK